MFSYWLCCVLSQLTSTEGLLITFPCTPPNRSSVGLRCTSECPVPRLAVAQFLTQGGPLGSLAISARRLCQGSLRARRRHRRRRHSERYVNYSLRFLPDVQTVSQNKNAFQMAKATVSRGKVKAVKFSHSQRVDLLEEFLKWVQWPLHSNPAAQSVHSCGLGSHSPTFEWRRFQLRIALRPPDTAGHCVPLIT